MINTRAPDGANNIVINLCRPNFKKKKKLEPVLQVNLCQKAFVTIIEFFRSTEIQEGLVAESTNTEI